MDTNLVPIWKSRFQSQILLLVTLAALRLRTALESIPRSCEKQDVASLIRTFVLLRLNGERRYRHHRHRIPKEGSKADENLRTLWQNVCFV
jgi:hypothetical protein